MPTIIATHSAETSFRSKQNHLGLKPGDAIDFIVVDTGDVLIRPAASDARALKGLLHRPGRKPISVEEMNRAVRLRKGKHS
jgi:bifunctional DNA-binding transcriptional regulator/antitoxin component of YhaV-PrlF toxin-antitoxin module